MMFRYCCLFFFTMISTGCSYNLLSRRFPVYFLKHQRKLSAEYSYSLHCTTINNEPETKRKKAKSRSRGIENKVSAYDRAVEDSSAPRNTKPLVSSELMTKLIEADTIVGNNEKRKKTQVSFDPLPKLILLIFLGDSVWVQELKH